MNTSDILGSMFGYKAWADAQLLAAVTRLDASKHPAEHHAALRILNHVHVVDVIFAMNLRGQPHGFEGANTPDTPSLGVLQQSMENTSRWFQGYVAGRGGKELKESLDFTFVDGSLGRMTREEMLMHVITHGGYHRGAVGRILAQNGVDPPRDIFTGYLHLTDPGRRGRK